MDKLINYVKYPNRRIYDLDSSVYVSFADIRANIREGYDIVVLDNKTKEDVTREVLVSILLEESLVSGPFMNENFMRAIILFYGNPSQKLLMDYFDQINKMINSFWATNSKNSNNSK
jgi:polyhydroxyalkanoate synthesis repressor PhaR